MPCIKIPFERGSTDGVVCPLRSDHVRACMAVFVWEKTGLVLFEQEITRLLTVLEGLAWQNQRLYINVKDAVDQEPVLEAILILLHVGEDDRFDGTTTKLLHVLRKKAKKYGVDTQSRSWPKGPAQLSRRIGELKELLNKANVKVEIGRHSGGDRYIILAKEKGSDVDAETPSHTQSVGKAHHPKPLQPPGGCDVKDVFDRLERPANPPTERKRS